MLQEDIDKIVNTLTEYVGDIKKRMELDVTKLTTIANMPVTLYMDSEDKHPIRIDFVSSVGLEEYFDPAPGMVVGVWYDPYGEFGWVAQIAYRAYPRLTKNQALHLCGAYLRNVAEFDYLLDEYQL